MHSIVGQEVLDVQNEKVIEVYANLSIVLETDVQTEQTFFGLGVVEEIVGCVQSDDLFSTDIDAHLSIIFFNDGSAAILVLETSNGNPRSLMCPRIIVEFEVCGCTQVS